MVHLYKLLPVQKEMVKKNKLVKSFNYEHNGVSLKILFYCLEQNILTITREDSKEYMSFLINKDFSVDFDLTTEEYKKLVKLIKAKFSKKNPFSPSNFWFDLSQNIPDVKDFKDENIHLTKYYVYDFIDDAYKTKFVRFVSHTNGSKVSTKNLNKTAIYFGKKEANKCKKENISSAWTCKKD